MHNLYAPKTNILHQVREGRKVKTVKIVKGRRMLKSFNARLWLRHTREDLDAIEILLRAGFYRHALFRAEQASEKIIKVLIIDELKIFSAIINVNLIQYLSLMLNSDLHSRALYVP